MNTINALMIQFLDFVAATASALAWYYNDSADEIRELQDQIAMIRERMEGTSSLISPAGRAQGRNDNGPLNGLENGLSRIEERTQKIERIRAKRSEIEMAMDLAGLSDADRKLLKIRHTECFSSKGAWVQRAREELHLEKSALYDRVAELESRLTENLWK